MTGVLDVVSFDPGAVISTEIIPYPSSGLGTLDSGTRKYILFTS